MKNTKQALLFFALLLPVSALAQGIFIPPRVVTGTVNGITRPVPAATITVCGPNTAGIPCSPALTGTVFKDSGLTVPLSNPFLTDANGNYPQAALAGGIYTITESAPGFAGFSYQVTVSCAPGAPCNITGPFTVTGALTAGSLNNLLWAGPGATPTIDTQITALGTNAGIVVVDPRYTGPAATLSPLFEKGQMVWNLNSPGTINAQLPAGNNTITYGGQDAGVVSQVRFAYAPASPLPAAKSQESIIVTAGYGGTLPTSTNSLEGLTSEAFTTGTITQTATESLVGLEGHSSVQSSSGTIANALGAQGEATLDSGTTNITNMVGMRGIGGTKAGTGTITNNYGGQFTQTAVGATRNYSVHMQGQALLTGPLDTGDATNFDIADHTGTAQHFLQMGSPADNININGIGGPVNLFNKAGTEAWTWASPNFQFDPNGSSLAIQFGSGPKADIQTSNGNFRPSFISNFQTGALLFSSTAPTIAGAGCGGTVASILSQNGTGSFEVNTGTAPGSACTITMPAATTSWTCDANHVSAISTTNFIIQQTGAISTTSVVLTLFSDVAAATSYQANDTLRVKCTAN